MTTPQLWAVCYHYVRDFQKTKFPRIHGMDLAKFEAQVDELAGRFEMATVESALEFLKGSYVPKKDLCLLTFDDGLKEHYELVTPILAKQKVAGLFFLITGAIEENIVAQVHKNHFLLASLPFADYRSRFTAKLLAKLPQFDLTVDDEKVKKTYRWDEPDVAAFKFILNFRVPDEVRSEILSELFAETLGSEAAFAKEL